MDALVELLASRLSEFDEAEEHRTLDAASASRRSANNFEIVTRLVAQALQNGLTLSNALPKTRDLSGGNTAMQVSIASAQVDFVFKMDKNAKLVREARTVEDLRADSRLGTFCSRLPKIYSRHDDGPPYAYLMEWFDSNVYPSLKQIFFGDRDDLPSETHAANIADYAFDALAEAY